MAACTSDDLQAVAHEVLVLETSSCATKFKDLCMRAPDQAGVEKDRPGNTETRAAVSGSGSIWY